MHNAAKISVAVTAMALLGSSVLAQTPPPPSAPAHHGIFSRFFHPKPKPGMTTPMHSGMTPNHSLMGSHSPMGGSNAMSGQYIGNKNSHVFHMPGDKGSLPAPQNRIYFPTAAAAEAAGYHAAGSGHTTTSHHTMMHGAPIRR